jgi:Asp-tRNA(Asn)/Glu-tRNA(Gln) amidotransferase A subunit family amidase
MSVPCGFTEPGIPTALQIAAAPWREDIVAAIGVSYQGVTDWHRKRPELSVI